MTSIPPPLPRYAGLHDEPDVPREELLLCDIVQSYDARDLNPSEPGSSGHVANRTACASVALAGEPGWVSSSFEPLRAAAVDAGEVVGGYDDVTHYTPEAAAAAVTLAAMAPAPHYVLTAEELGCLGACEDWRDVLAPLLPIVLSADVRLVRREVQRVGEYINRTPEARRVLFGEPSGGCSGPCDACDRAHGKSDPLDVVNATWLASRLSWRVTGGGNIDYDATGAYRWNGYAEGERGVQLLAFALEALLGAGNEQEG